ncbi:MAG: hypothetical protein R3272_01165 [Candidatus Promineifilaceae bacterium]|nr:hypothetical protein [Candidatus Promineifilaceae bacterium]
MRDIGVDCLFEEDGTVRVRRIAVRGKWEGVEQGRQWQDEEGRHVLVMRHGATVQEIVLAPETLRWEIKPAIGGQARAV